ncbi:putative ribonuclease H-like domain-containing protein [Tanacetum coccineum]
MIQPEPEGSTQGYPLDSVEVLRSVLTDSKVTLTKHGRMTKLYSPPALLLTVLFQEYLKMVIETSAALIAMLETHKLRSGGLGSLKMEIAMFREREKINVVGTKTSIKLLVDPNMPTLEHYSIFNSSSDGHDDGAKADMNNLDTSIQEEPKKVIHALKDPSWIEAMHEDLLQFKLQEVWTLVDLPNRKRAIGYTQEEGIEYDEVVAPIARIEAIRLILAYASFKDFMVYQMDVKSDFLYGKIKEEVYACQPPGFEDPDFPDRVYKVEKALYGLHQAPRAWYKGDILLVQVYVDDIIFGSTKKELYIVFEKLMHEKFQMSSMGELTFFLGLQVKQKKDGIFISQDKYVAKILKKFRFTEVKTISTPIETQKPLLKDEDGE